VIEDEIEILVPQFHRLSETGFGQGRFALAANGLSSIQLFDPVFRAAIRAQNDSTHFLLSFEKIVITIGKKSTCPKIKNGGDPIEMD